MKFKKIFLLLIILAVFSILFFVFLKNNNFDKRFEDLNINYVKIGEQVVKVELASTVESQEKGLSGREKLGENTGMLFVFKDSGIYSFWMKDMKFAIDIIWINEDRNIVFIKKNVLPSTFPETFSPEKKSLYVLELVSGFSEKNNLKEGNFVEFLP